jgi:hypothetical protein
MRHGQMKPNTRALLAAIGWLALLFMSVWIWGVNRNDPFAIVMTVFRILIVVPLATALSIEAVRQFDKHTPGDWLAAVTDDQHGNIGTKIGTGLVVGALIFSIFWVCVQG